MDDLISRRSAIESVRKYFKFIELNPDICVDGIINIPSAEPEQKLKKLADEIAEFKRHIKSENSDYLKGYLCALSVVEGMIADDKLLFADKALKELPSAKIDNKINLCDSCQHVYPECPSGNNDVIFGSALGNDNICACSKYLPSAQPEYKLDEWCTDCKEYDNKKKCCPRFNRVIREALKEAEPEPTYEQVKRYCNRRGLSIVESALLVKNQSVEPEWNNHKDVPDNNEDVISRQAAKQKLISFISETNMSDIYPGINNAISLVVDKLPSVEPERKMGKWIYDQDDLEGDTWNCSECGERWILLSGTPELNNMNYCPRCGAKMEGEQDEFRT